MLFGSRRSSNLALMQTSSGDPSPHALPAPPMRSEERRVGKECRYQCDWSSDVSSSDLSVDLDVVRVAPVLEPRSDADIVGRPVAARVAGAADEIGRASCRERV